MLPHLHNGWQVDQAILSEEDKVVVIRFGHDWDPTCMKMDEVLYKVAEKIKNFTVIYLVDITETPDFNKINSTEQQQQQRCKNIVRQNVVSYLR
ncbi:unnamed protein product [Rotaria sp. Silwood2]|nr:unnamed protein product [Rotaria sp. Silwood2]